MLNDTVKLLHYPLGASRVPVSYVLYIYTPFRVELCSSTFTIPFYAKDSILSIHKS